MSTRASTRNQNPHELKGTDNLHNAKVENKEHSRGRFYRPVKRPVTLRLDADVIAWLKKDGPGYQTRANRILRTEMLRSVQHKPKREGSLADFLLASPLRGSGIEIKRLLGPLRKVDL